MAINRKGLVCFLLASIFLLAIACEKDPAPLLHAKQAFNTRNLIFSTGGPGRMKNGNVLFDDASVMFVYNDDTLTVPTPTKIIHKATKSFGMLDLKFVWGKKNENLILKWSQADGWDCEIVYLSKKLDLKTHSMEYYEELIEKDADTYLNSY